MSKGEKIIITILIIALSFIVADYVQSGGVRALADAWTGSC